MRKCLAIVLAILLCVACLPQFGNSAAAAADYSYIRVKLSVTNATSLSISLKGSYFIEENGASFTGGTLSLRTNFDGTLTVTHSSLGEVYTGKSLWLMREKIDRSAGYARFAVSGVTRNYLGHFYIKVTSSGYLQVINKVPLAHYLYGVIRGEMGNAFPLEALKAQAIASKCYAIKNLTSGKEYDITDTSADQVYKGYDSSESNVITAVDSTINEVLTVNGSIICTYYAASNGGETKLVTQAWSNRGSNAGYAVALDDYDFNNSLSLKETAFFPIGGGTMSSKVQLFLAQKAANVLGTSVASVDSITSVTCYSPRYTGSTRDMTRAQISMLVTTGIGSGTSSSSSSGIMGFDPFGLFGTSTSTDISTDTSGTAGTGSFGTQTTVSIDFALSELTSSGVFTNSSLRIYWGESVAGGYNIYHVRYGHGVGLSQRGAQQRALSGHNYRQILAFYYPGATLSAITVSTPQDPVKPVTSQAPTETDTASTYPAYGTTTGSVNFRTGPGTAYSTMGEIPAGTQVIVYSYANNWYYVTLNGVPGYMSADYLALGGSASLDASATATPTPTQTIGTAVSYGAVTSSGVNFRMGPGTAYQSLGKLNKGTELILYGKSGTWYQASVSGVTGYISASYVKVTGSGTITNQTDSVATPTPTPSEIAPVESPTVTSVTYGTVTGSGVNFRTGPGTAYQSLGKLKKGTELIVYGKENGWYYVEASGTKGYISASYVKVTSTVQTVVDATPTPTPTPNASSYSVGTVLANGVNLRDMPTTSGSAVLYKLAKNTQVTVYSRSGDWYYVKYGSAYGYISSSYLKITSEIAGETTVPSDSASNTATVIGTGEVTASGVNFRKGPSTSYKTISQLKKGTVLTLYALEDGWYEAEANGTHGYVSAKYVKLTSSAQPSTGTAAGTTEAASSTATGETTGKVNFRTKASQSSSLIETLKKGTKVSILGEEGSWYHVSYNGKTGYLYRAYVKVVSAGTEASSSSSSEQITGITSRPAVTNGDVNFRQSPSLSGVINYEIPKGTEISVYGTENGWCLIGHGTLLGYVSADYVTYK